MYRFLYFFICILISFSELESSFADCTITDELPSNSELTSKIDACIEARLGKWESPNSFTEFVCPQGPMFLTGGATITRGRLAYAIAVNLAFNKTDIDIKKYMQELRKNREPDPEKWIENIDSCTKKIEDIYDNICKFWTLDLRINENIAKQYIVDTTAYPQELCYPLAARKIKWWRNVAKIMMSDGIYKNKKNSTDKWATEVKWAYAKLLMDWHNYQKILARAANKMTGTNKRVVWK